MTTRRGNGEGTIRQRTDGRWEAQLSLPSGKRKSVYGKTKKEAREALKAALKKLDEGVDLGAPAQTLGVFLEQLACGHGPSPPRPEDPQDLPRPDARPRHPSPGHDATRPAHRAAGRHVAAREGR